MNAKERISLNDEKIIKADKEVEDEAQQWKDLPRWQVAYNIYDLMLDENGKSNLKAIVAQCLASILRWNILSEIPNNVKPENMFDIDLYAIKVDEAKRMKLKDTIEKDQFLGYIVGAIKYAAGENL